MRDQHVEFAAWLQHADPGFRQGGDRPIPRLPNEPGGAEPLRRPPAGRPGHADPRPAVAGDDHATSSGRRPGGLDLRRRGAVLAAALRARRRPRRPAASWTRILPVVREPGLFRTEAEVRLSTQSTYTLELTPEGRGDPIFEFHADPIRNRTILTSLPGMYWSFPVTRARPGATVLARHGDPRMQNQYGRHVLLASQLYGPGRTVFLGFDSTYRWRFLSRGLLRRLLGAPDRPRGPEQGARGAVPVPGEPGQERLSGRRPGVGRRPLHRGRRAGRGVRAGGRAGGRRRAAGTAPVREGARRPRLADGHLPGRARPAPTRCGSSRRRRATPPRACGPRRRPSASSRRGGRSTSPR